MNLSELLELKRVAEKGGLTLDELEKLAGIWEKCQRGLLMRTANELANTVLTTMYVRANDIICRKTDDTKLDNKQRETLEAVYLMRAKMIINSKVGAMVTPVSNMAAWPTPSAFPNKML